MKVEMSRSFLSTLGLSALGFAFLLGATATIGFAQGSPPAQTNVSIGGKKISIRYSAPSVRGRKIFGDGGLLSRDPTYPAWRAGADSATALHKVPKGDYTLYCWVKDPENWELIISKETGQWGLTYTPSKDLGRVKMTMSKPATPIEQMKFTLSDQGGGKAKLELAWERHVGSVIATLK
jgi:hypothetical protein